LQYKRQMSAGRTRSLVTLHVVGPSMRARALDVTRRATERIVDHARDLRDKYRDSTDPPTPAEED
jgi:hypothetical protein